MEEPTEYERIEQEYRSIQEAYEDATQELMRIAAAAECDVAEFRRASDRVSHLASKLQDLRAAMMLLHGQRWSAGASAPDPEPPRPQV